MQAQKSVPQVKGDFLIGNLRPLLTNSFKALCDWHRQYGDMVGFKIAGRQFYLFSHPKLVEEALILRTDVFVKMYDPQKPTGLALVLGQGLVTSQGELWQRQRRLMQPVFQRKNLDILFSQMVAATEQMFGRWQTLGDGAELNLADEMMRLTLEIITQTMFGTSVLDKVDRIAPALDTVLRFASKSVLSPVSLPLAVPTKANRAFKQAMGLLDEVIYGIIADRRNHPSHGRDLLDMLLEAGDQDSGEKMSVRQIRDEVITIFSAGHETTANLLNWTLYLLAKHPDVLAKLRRELDALPKHRAPDTSELQALSYTKAVLSESMRIRPPVGVMIRKVSRDTEIDGYALKAGSLAIINIYNVHHHPEFWPEPERFDPERFLGNENRRYAYIPFGSGERICIGNQFAMLESQLLLSMIISRYDFELLDPGEAEVELAVSLRPKGGVRVKIRSLV